MEGTSNGFTVHTPLNFNAAGGSMKLGPIAVSDFFLSSENPRIAFTMGLQVDVDQLLRSNNLKIPGLEGCVLSGPPVECLLAKNGGLRGPWELVTGATTEYNGDAVMSAPFYGGKLALTHFNARGLFGPAPLLGGNLVAAGAKWPERNPGINIQDILKYHPKYGQFNARVNAYIRNFEMASLRLREGLKNYPAYAQDLASLAA